VNERARLIEKRTPHEDGSADVWRYGWDAAGRLAAVELPDGRRAEYAYDPQGRRLEARLYGERAFGSRPLTVDSANVPGYNYSDASSMLVPKQEHQLITKGQNARQAARECAGRGAWSSTPREELNGIADDYDSAGIDEKHKRRAIKSAYKLMAP
jgi:YD repeat-containing protein